MGSDDAISLTAIELPPTASAIIVNSSSRQLNATNAGDMLPLERVIY